MIMKLTSKLLLIVAGIAAIFIVSSCDNKPEDTGLKVEEVIPVSIVPIAQKQGEIVVTGSGLFSTDDETLLSFKNGGIIDRIYVKEGDFVKKGQLLATLNMTELNAKSAQVSAAMEKAQRDYNRAEQLYKDSVATLEQFQNAKTGLEVIEQDWNTIEFNREFSQIRARSDGYILAKLQSEGEIVGPGMPVFMANGAGDWVVKIGVSDKEWNDIKEGDSAVIRTDAFTEDIPATVVRKSEGLDPNSLTFTIYIQPHSTKGLSIASGMFAKVEISRKTTESWFIPYASLLDGDRGKGFVFVTDDKETAQKVEVEIGAIYKDEVLISKGLEDYKYLVVSGSPYLVDGSKIKITQ